MKDFCPTCGQETEYAGDSKLVCQVCKKTKAEAELSEMVDAYARRNSRTLEVVATGSLFSRFISGDLSIGKAFWLFGVLGNFLIAFLLSMLIGEVGAAHPVSRLSAAACLAIWVALAVGQWRCAKNSKTVLWTILLKAWIALQAISGLAQMHARS